MKKIMESCVIENIKIVDVAIPYLIPFVISGGSCDSQRSIIVELTSEGITAYGESAPVEVPIYSSETTSSAIAALKEWFIPKVAGKAFQSIEHFNEVLSRETRGNNFAKAAIETAYWDLVARKNNISMKELIRYKLQQLDTDPKYLYERDYVLSGVSIGIPGDDSTDTLKKWIEGYIKEGYNRIKLKIKPGWEIPAMKAAREVIGYDFPLWGDANSAYVLDKHIDILKGIDDYNCLFLEQPLHHDDLIDHIKLSKQMKTPICLDESLKSYRVAAQSVESGVKMVWNLKIHRMGGLLETLKVYSLASKNGVDVWGGTMPETGIGSVPMLCLASFSGFKYPSDIEDSSRWYGRGKDLIEICMDNQGRIPVPVGTGVGEINMENYKRFGRTVYEYSAVPKVVSIPPATEEKKYSIERAEYTEEVIDALKSLEKQAFGEGAFDEWALVPYIRHGNVFVMRYMGRIMAYTVFMKDWDEGDKVYFVSTVVHDTLQGKGIGTSFIRDCLIMIKEMGYNKVELTVAPDNQRAIKIYRDRLGFAETGFNKDEYGKGQDRILMELDLNRL